MVFVKSKGNNSFRYGTRYRYEIWIYGYNGYQLQFDAGEPSCEVVPCQRDQQLVNVDCRRISKGLSTPVSETGDFVAGFIVARNGNKIAGFRRQNRRFLQQI